MKLNQYIGIITFVLVKLMLVGACQSGNNGKNYPDKKVKLQM